MCSLLHLEIPRARSDRCPSVKSNTSIKAEQTDFAVTVVGHPGYSFSLQHGFWPTRNVPASISLSTVIRKERFLNDKPEAKQLTAERVKCFEISNSTWAYSREHFPHKPFEMVLF